MGPHAGLAASAALRGPATHGRRRVLGKADRPRRRVLGNTRRPRRKVLRKAHRQRRSVLRKTHRPRPWTCWCRGSRSVCLQTAPQVPALNLRQTNALPQQPHVWNPKHQLCSAYFVRQPLRAIQSDCAKWTKLLDLRSAHWHVETTCTTTTTVKKKSCCTAGARVARSGGCRRNYACACSLFGARPTQPQSSEHAGRTCTCMCQRIQLHLIAMAFLKERRKS